MMVAIYRREDTPAKAFSAGKQSKAEIGGQRDGIG